MQNQQKTQKLQKTLSNLKDDNRFLSSILHIAAEQKAASDHTSDEASAENLLNNF